MKRMKWLGAGIVALLIMTGCNESSTTEVEDQEVEAADVEEEATTEEVVTEEAEEETEPIDEEVAEEENSEELSIEDILTKSIEAMNGVESFTTEMDVDQETTLGEDETFTTQMKMKMDATQNPLAFYQQTSMQMPELEEATMNAEVYFTEDGAYMNDGMEDVWFKYPDEFTQDLLALQEMQMNPEEQLELLKSYTENLTMTEEGDHYIITIEGSDQSIDQMADQLNMMLGEGMADGLSELTAMMDITRMDYMIHINKETFYQEAIDMAMEFSMEAEGETISMVQQSTGTFSNFNEIDSIEVPQEIIDSAEEFSFDFEDFEDFDETEFELEEEETDE
ncbi:DUF6612 family protein [Alkalihalophilus lindianensis]|uniref:DUF6612 family protein n=1 Tax=Alkalihalophilus lindianensis TaxID=1630542 RepID=A0ABU3X8N9_9BACI|nr:DUF6612 family protein [Alkalihalophilus lindianensis]MDV2684261.1 DUF6612 family protein [Alkalihalophilus lindianensis]